MKHPLISLLKRHGSTYVVGLEDGRITCMTAEAWEDFPTHLKHDATPSSQAVIQVAHSIAPVETHNLTLQTFAVPCIGGYVTAAFDATHKQWFVRV